MAIAMVYVHCSPGIGAGKRLENSWVLLKKSLDASPRPQIIAANGDTK